MSAWFESELHCVGLVSERKCLMLALCDKKILILAWCESINFLYQSGVSKKMSPVGLVPEGIVFFLTPG